MLTAAVRAQANKYLVYAALGATVFVTPWFNLDPINIVKMVALVSFGFLAFFSVAPGLKGLWVGFNRYLIGLVLLFVLWLVMVFVSDDSPRWQQFFGTFGRNTGFISYLALALVFLTATLAVDKKGARRIALALLLAGLVNAVYGFVQFLGADPIDWSNPYNRILGTLGNPNFASSLLGMAAIASFAWALGAGVRGVNRIGGFVLAFVALFLAYKSDSIQGIAIALVGVFILGYQVLVKILNLRWARIPYLLIGFGGFSLAVMGALQKGPLASLIYQDSVTYRGDYWRAGIAMTKDSPLFGVGLDSYGDYYRQFRAIEAVNRRGPDIVSNSAHNVFLDISSTGGIPLLFIYLVIVALAVRSAYRVLSSAKSFDWVATSLVGAWAAYLAQSSISINQLGLAVWGWLLPGAIIGLDLNRDLVDPPVVKSKKTRVQLPARNYLSGVVGGVLGLLISIWPLVYDASFRSALTAGDGDKVVSKALSFPKNNYHLNYAAQAFVENKLNDKALVLFQQANLNNGRDFFALQGLANAPTTAPSERSMLLAKMREIDPLNPSIPSE